MAFLSSVVPRLSFSVFTASLSGSVLIQSSNSVPQTALQAPRSSAASYSFDSFDPLSCGSFTASTEPGSQSAAEPAPWGRREDGKTAPDQASSGHAHPHRPHSHGEGTGKPGQLPLQAELSVSSCSPRVCDPWFRALTFLWLIRFTESALQTWSGGLTLHEI